MGLIDGTYVARKNIFHLPGSPYAVGDEVPGSEFTDDGHARKYIANGIVDIVNGSSELSQRYDSVDIAFNTSGLNTVGIPIFTPSIGSILLDVWVEVTQPWNGTTPKIDFGSFEVENWGICQNWIDSPMNLIMTDWDTHGLYLHESSSLSNYPSATNTVTGVVPARFTSAAPFRAVVSQNGAKGGTAVGGTTGEATVRALWIKVPDGA